MIGIERKRLAGPQAASTHKNGQADRGSTWPRNTAVLCEDAKNLAERGPARRVRIHPLLSQLWRRARVFARRLRSNVRPCLGEAGTIDLRLGEAKTTKGRNWRGS